MVFFAVASATVSLAGFASLVGAAFAGVFLTDAVAVVFFDVFATGVAAAFFVAVVFAFLFTAAVFGASAVAPDALECHPRRFHFPTTAFLDNPKRLPISAVDNPLPVKAFNFFNVALSQPLLMLQNPCYTYYCVIVTQFRFERQGGKI